MIVRQVPDEIGHDAADDDAGEELDAADGVEGEARVVRRGRFGTAVERVEHGVCVCVCMFRMFMCVYVFSSAGSQTGVACGSRGWIDRVVGRAR